MEKISELAIASSEKIEVNKSIPKLPENEKVRTIRFSIKPKPKFSLESNENKSVT